MSNPKVFEFAKEIGFTPLALMDKIKEWNLPVRSHMAELEPEMIETIRSRLSESGGKDSAPKKTATRKKAPAAAAPAPAKAAAPAAKAAAPKAAAPKAVRKAPPKKAEAAAEESAAALKAKSGTVVRRKSKPTEAEAAEEAAQAEAAAALEASTAEVEHTPEPEAEVEEAPPVVVVPEVVVAKATPAPARVEAPIEKPIAVAPAPVVEEVKAKVKEAAPVAATPETPSEDSIKKPVVARKKEVAIGASGVASAGVTAAARRNIVGRMDLSRVQAPAGGPPGRPGFDRSSGPGRPPGPGQPPGAAGGPAGFGAANRSKGNLRAGFFRQSAPMATPPPAPDFHEDHARRKLDEKKRAKGGTPAEGAAGREIDEQPPVFDAAEFRKREMVFQPKKKRGMLNRPSMQTQITKASARKRVLKVQTATMKVSQLANEMGIKAAELVKVLMKSGVQASMNSDLDFDTIALIAPEFGWEASNSVRTVEELLDESSAGDLEAERIVRPPVVTIMGHVDHGKTSLLDAIRSAKVAAGEAGGITQHIGAYQVSLDDGYKITFLDTPGHEAFTAMRARGANATDIAVIVVAADDGVMPQTAEAINHAKAAGVPLIIAVNKMDKPGANPDKIKQQMTEFEIVPEEWGGTTIFAPVSAHTKKGIPELLEHIKLVAEVQELKANPKRTGKGIVIESRLEKGRGPVATLLVQDGTVKVGQYLVAGMVVGRVRSLMTDRGDRVDEALPGMPVEVLGLESVPQAGDRFDIVQSDEDAREVAKVRQDAVVKSANPNSKMSLEDIFSKVQKGDMKELAVVLKADVAGSLEAILGMFQKIGTSEVKLKVVHSAVGGINSSDVLLASTAKGIIIGFNVRPDGAASQEARRLGVEIRSYSIVYEMMDEVKKALAGLLAPTVVEKIAGRAEVRNTFTVPKIGTIAGCFVSEGKILRSNIARLVRDGKVIYEGKIGSLKRFKDDAREVAQGFECGIGIENFNDVKVGDVIEAFSREEVQRTLEESAAL